MYISNADRFELPSGDGIKYAYVRFRDGAERPRVSRALAPRDYLTGNSGPEKFEVIGLDTTAPVAALADDTVEVVAGQPATLDATPSTDASAGVATSSFEWRWGDGSANQPGQPGSVQHTYPGPGTYTGRVIVYDNTGPESNFSSAEFTVIVRPADVTPEATPTPAPTPPPASDPPASAPVATGTDAPIDTTPPGIKPDIPLEQIPAEDTARKGALASLKADRTVEPREPIDVRLRLRRNAKVQLKLLDSDKDVVAKKASREERGRQKASIRAPALPGDYTLLAKAGKRKPLRLAVEVVAAG